MEPMSEAKSDRPEPRDADADPLARLPPTPRAALAPLVADARARQRREVQRAIDDALTHVPALLRGAIRRLLFS